MTINLRAVPRDQWPERFADVRRVAVFQDARLLVQVFEEDAQVVRISVNATALGKKGGRWKDGLSWDVLQAINDVVGYADRDVVEFCVEELMRYLRRTVYLHFCIQFRCSDMHNCI